MSQTPHPLLWLFALTDAQRWAVEGEQLLSNFLILAFINDSRAFTGDSVVVIQYQSLIGIHCVEQELLDIAISEVGETSIGTGKWSQNVDQHRERDYDPHSNLLSQ